MTPFQVSFYRRGRMIGHTTVDAVDNDQAEELAREQLPVEDTDTAIVATRSSVPVAA